MSPICSRSGQIGSDDQAKLYLNGRLVYENRMARPLTPDQDTVAEIGLEQGVNVIVLKVVNELLDWQGSVRLTDKEGSPVKGIKVTLTP